MCFKVLNIMMFGCSCVACCLKNVLWLYYVSPFCLSVVTSPFLFLNFNCVYLWIMLTEIKLILWYVMLCYAMFTCFLFFCVRLCCLHDEMNFIYWRVVKLERKLQTLRDCLLNLRREYDKLFDERTEYQVVLIASVQSADKIGNTCNQTKRLRASDV